MPVDPSSTSGPTPSNYQRTTGGNLQWKPPTVERLQQLLSGYEVIEILGMGGMGAVYKARQISLDRLVAVKILPPEAAGDEDANFVERFRNEARTMAKMNHPAIVSVFDFGETSEGQLYIVMEFVDGTDVSKMILSQGKLPPEYALAITAHVCDALQYAHTHGIIHRDIKPANILINMEGAVKVADFGLAKASDAGQAGLTKTNMAMGTPDFVAPEALIAGMNVDGRADLYAVGVMLYNMLTGNVPRGMFRMPSTTVKTDPRFDQIITRSMEMDREMRYQTAFDIRKDLDVILSTPHVEAGGQSSAAIPKQSPPQKPMAKGPQKPQGKSAEVPVRDSPSKTAQPPAETSAPHSNGERQLTKSKMPMIVGITTMVMIVAGLFFAFKPKPPASTPEEVPETSSAPIKVVEKSKDSGSSKPALTQADTKTPPASTSTAQGRVVDLLPLIEVKRDSVWGAWFLAKDGLEVRTGGNNGTEIGGPRLRLPYEPPEEYDFEVEFTPTEGSGDVRQVMSAAARSFDWCMDVGLSAGKKAGFETIDGTRIATRKEGTAMRDRLLTNGRRHRSRVEVRKGRLRGFLDDELLVDWGGDFKRLDLPSMTASRDTMRFGLAAYSRAVTFHKIRVREITGAGKIMPGGNDARLSISSSSNAKPATDRSASSTTIDLLALIDPEKDAVAGHWKKEGGKLVCDMWGVRPGDFRTIVQEEYKAGGARIEVPYEPPEEYDFRVVFTRRGRSDVDQILSKSGKSFLWGIGERDNKWKGFQLIDNKEDNPTRTEFKLEDGRTYTSEVQVRNDGLKVFIDGTLAAEWKTDYTDMSQVKFWQLRDNNLLGVGAWACEATFTSINVREITGHGRVTRTAPAGGDVSSSSPTLAAITSSTSKTSEEKVAMPPTASGNLKSEIPDGKSNDPRLAQLAAGFKARYDSDAQKPFLAALATLNQSYVTSGIARARTAAQKKGALSEVSALDDEKKRIEQDEGVPAEDADTLPSSLKELRATYRTALAKIEADRATKSAPLYDLYVGALDAYVTELTKANKIEEAQKVKTLREEIAAQKTLPPAQAAPGGGRTVSLFDGKSLQGWTQAGDRDAFIVEDGAIKATGKPANLVFTGAGKLAPPWKDLDLTLKVKTGDKGNSGVWIHCPLTPTSERAFALEVQLLNSTSDTRRTGSIYNIADVSGSLAQDNEWFDLRITVRRKTITVYINGTKANEWKQPADWQPGGKVPNARIGEGSIGFQSMSGVAWFKDIHVVLP